MSSIGAFTSNFDLPLLLVDVFVVFFFVLVLYLHQEGKREGYPLVSDRTDRTGGRVKVVGFPGMPRPKTFYRPHGLPPVTVPRADDPSPKPDAPHQGNWQGMPIDDGTPRLGQSLGPGSWVERADDPDRSYTGSIVFRPMRHATNFRIMAGEADPRGYVVLGCDKARAGVVTDVWIDESEHHARFLEIELDAALRDARPASSLPPHDGALAAPAGGGEGDAAPAAASSILLPIDFAAVSAHDRTVRTATITGAQFASVPGRRRDLSLTAREENRLRGYYGGGYLWATPARVEPLL